VNTTQSLLGKKFITKLGLFKELEEE